MCRMESSVKLSALNVCICIDPHADLLVTPHLSKANAGYSS